MKYCIRTEIRNAVRDYEKLNGEKPKYILLNRAEMKCVNFTLDEMNENLTGQLRESDSCTVIFKRIPIICISDCIRI